MNNCRGIIPVILSALLVQISPVQAGASSGSLQGSNGYAIAAAVGGVALAAAGACYLWKSSSSCARNVRRWFQRTLGMKQDVHQTAAQGDLAAIQVQLARAAQIAFDKEAAQISLRDAAIRGDLELVQTFLDNGAEVNAVDWHGSTPLYEAVRRGYVEVVRMLLGAGARVNTATGLGNTPLHEAAAGGCEETVHVLLAAGATVDAPNAGGYTPLHAAVKNGRAKALQALLGAHARLNARASNGYTALHTASERIHADATDAVRVLLEAGADIHALAGKRRETPLFLAARNGHLDVVRELVTRGAELIRFDVVKLNKCFQRFDKDHHRFTGDCAALAKRRLQVIAEGLDVLPDAVVDTHVGPFAGLSKRQLTALQQARTEQRAMQAAG